MHSTTSKSSCDLYTRISKASSSKSDKIHRTPTPKRVITSKKLPSYADNKSFSAGFITNKAKAVIKPKKTTKSDFSFNKHSNNCTVDYCKNCGDAIKSQIKITRPKIHETDVEIKTIIGLMNEKCVRNDNNVKTDHKRQKSVQQYYKNENFQLSTESVHAGDNTKKISLDPIREVPEGYTEESIFQLYSDSEDEPSQDSHNNESIKELKEFRRNNYFECHSAKSRISTKPSAISLKDHKCVYRFYLNDRLFPVPLNADHNNRIRCVECHLPMGVKKETLSKNINGTIQAKVKLGIGQEAQDMTLLLPVKDTLIIEERRKERKVDEEVIYFGVIKLNANGNSKFNSTHPYNSLALKYQKGYKEFSDDNRYCYKNLDDTDVIVI